MEKLKNTRILALVGSIAIFLGIILPYLKITFFGYTSSISLWGYWEGKIAMILLLINIAFIFRDYIEKYIPQLFDKIPNGDKIRNANPKLAIIPVILIALFAIYLLNEVHTSSYLKYGIGFWSLWIGIAALIAHTFICKVDATKTEIAIENANSQPVTPQAPIMNQAVSNTNTQEPVSFNEPVTNQQNVVNNQFEQPVEPIVQPTQNVVQQPQQVPVQPQVAAQPQPVEQVVQSKENVVQQPVQPQVKICPICGASVDATLTTCPMCGNNI